MYILLEKTYVSNKIITSFGEDVPVMYQGLLRTSNKSGRLSTVCHWLAGYTLKTPSCEPNVCQ